MGTTKELKLHWIVIANFLNNTGAALMWPLTTVYMHNYLHQSLATAGVVLFLMSSAMVIGNYVGGWLFDHWSTYWTAVSSVSIALVAVCLLIFFNGWPTFALLLIVVGFGDGINVTVVNAFAVSAKKRESRFIFNLMYMALNLGVVVGTLLVGFLLPIGIRVVFTVTTAFYALFWIVTVAKFNVPIEQRSTTAKVATKPNQVNQSVHLVWLICILVAISYLSYALWESVMAVHLTSMHIPFYAYSLLWTINGIIILVGQPFVTMLAPYLKLRRQIAIGVSIFALSFVGLVFVNTFWGFVVDFSILTIGEMLGLPAIPAWVDRLTNNVDTGKYQGMVNMAISVGRAIGPLFGGVMIDWFSYNALFVTVTVLTMGCLLVVLTRASKVEKIQ